MSYWNNNNSQIMVFETIVGDFHNLSDQFYSYL